MFLKLGYAGVVLSVLALSHVAAQDMPLGSDLPFDPQPQPAQSSILDEPIHQIADSAGGCAVLDKDFPGLREHSMYPFFKSMSLNQIAALSKGQITPDMLAQAKTDLTAMTTEPQMDTAVPANVVTPAPAPVSTAAAAAAH